MSRFIAVLDACVLYPAPLRDLLVSLASEGLFRAKWSDEIHDEWIRNLLKNRSNLTRENLDRTRTLMNTAVLDSLVKDYEKYIPIINLPDLDDRHVLATAIESKAHVIVTFNQKDFPPEELEKFHVCCEHPDEFITNINEHSEQCGLKHSSTPKTTSWKPSEERRRVFGNAKKSRIASDG